MQAITSISRFPSDASSKFKGQRGAALVEYAFTFIFSMTLFLGIMEFGHALYAYHFVNEAAKEASRWAAVNGANCSYDSSCNGVAPMNSGPASSSDVSTFVQSLVPAGIDASQVTTTACWPANSVACPATTGVPNFCISGNAAFTGANSPGCTVQVTVSYNFSFIFPLIPGGPIAMSSTSDMTVVH
jgi:Flp pilus assembly protein TadG